MNRSDRKKLYHKILRVIEYNTLNQFQGPAVKYSYVHRLGGVDRKEFDKMCSLLKEQQKIFEINRSEHRLTLRDDPHLLALIEQELEKDAPNREFIGHVNQLREKT